MRDTAQEPPYAAVAHDLRRERGGGPRRTSSGFTERGTQVTVCVSSNYDHDEVNDGGGIAACHRVSITRIRVTLDTTQPQAFHGASAACRSQPGQDPSSVRVPCCLGRRFRQPRTRVMVGRLAPFRVAGGQLRAAERAGRMLVEHGSHVKPAVPPASPRVNASRHLRVHRSLPPAAILAARRESPGE